MSYDGIWQLGKEHCLRGTVDIACTTTTHRERMTCEPRGVENFIRLGL